MAAEPSCARAREHCCCLMMLFVCLFMCQNTGSEASAQPTAPQNRARATNTHIPRFCGFVVCLAKRMALFIRAPCLPPSPSIVTSVVFFCSVLLECAPFPKKKNKILWVCAVLGRVCAFFKLALFCVLGNPTNLKKILSVQQSKKTHAFDKPSHRGTGCSLKQLWDLL